jgi:hypothetical protein
MNTGASVMQPCRLQTDCPSAGVRTQPALDLCSSTSRSCAAVGRRGFGRRCGSGRAVARNPWTRRRRSVVRAAPPTPSAMSAIFEVPPQADGDQGDNNYQHRGCPAAAYTVARQSSGCHFSIRSHFPAKPPITSKTASALSHSPARSRRSTSIRRRKRTPR